MHHNRLLQLLLPSTRPAWQERLGGSYKARAAAIQSSFLSSSSSSSSSSSIPNLQRPSRATQRQFSSSSKSLTMSDAYLKTVEGRRTFYGLNKAIPASLTNEKIRAIVEKVVLHTPSAFNTQTTRLVVLTGAEHDKFWDLASQSLRKFQTKKAVDAGKPAPTFNDADDKPLSFKPAYGTILFYDGSESLDEKAVAMPFLKSKVEEWLNHSNAMHQIHLWTALEAEGAGANLQHYNPVINEATAEQWNIPKHWVLRAQLVFGGREGLKVGEKEQTPLEKRVFFHHA